MEHFNQLTPAEAERLAIVMEECAEVAQVIGKILRHGYESRHPAGGATNRSLLQKELGDVMASISMLGEAHDIDADAMMAHGTEKLRTVQQWLHHQPPTLPRGTQPFPAPQPVGMCQLLGRHQFDIASGMCRRCGFDPRRDPPPSTAQVMAG